MNSDTKSDFSMEKGQYTPTLLCSAEPLFKQVGRETRASVEYLPI